MITLTQKHRHGIVTCEHGVDGVSPSARLVRAAAAERDQLTGHRDRLLTAREETCKELARIDASLHELGERVRLLDRLAGPQNSSEPAVPGGNQTRRAAMSGDPMKTGHVDLDALRSQYAWLQTQPGDDPAGLASLCVFLLAYSLGIAARSVTVENLDTVVGDSGPAVNAPARIVTPDRTPHRPRADL